jgi:hypothetical protein
MAMNAMTTNNSTSVKPGVLRVRRSKANRLPDHWLAFLPICAETNKNLNCVKTRQQPHICKPPPFQPSAFSL